MKAAELVQRCKEAGPEFQLYINDFVDTFRRTT
jgi:hypothetical protein